MHLELLPNIACSQYKYTVHPRESPNMLHYGLGVYL
jgi:hypothetical protein